MLAIRSLQSSALSLAKYKRTLLACGILIFLILLGFAVLFFIFVNPAHLKAQFTEQVYRRTGLQVQINGPVSWVLAPQLGVRFAQVAIKEPMASAARVDVFIAWRPLITGRVEIQKLAVHQISLHIRQAVVSGDLQVDVPEQRLRIKPLMIASDNLQATGQASGENLFQNPQFTGQLVIVPFQWGRVIFHHATTHFHFSKTQGLTGDIADDHITVGHSNIQKVTAKYVANFNKVRFTEVQGNTAGGVLTAEVTVKNPLTAPRYEVVATLEHVELSQLLPSNILEGAADVKMDITADAVINGTVQLTAENGVLNRIDLLKQIREVKQFLQANPEATARIKATPFSRFTASGRINNDLLTNDDFLLESSDVQATGTGTVNLADEEIAYRLLVKAQGKMFDQDFGLTVPLKISGTLSHPKVKIDLGDAKLSIGKSLHHDLKILFGHHNDEVK